MSGFEGFRYPKSNFFSLPNEWTDITHDMTSLAEMKCVEYVLRHTWGWQEFEEARRISLDEFEHGRKRKNGSRWDRGIGMSQPSIIKGIKEAVKHGFLEANTESGDKGRARKFYRLRMLKILKPGSKETLELIPSSFRPYIEIQHKKDTDRSKDLSGGHLSVPTPPNDLLGNGKFTSTAGQKLLDILVKNESDLVQPPRKIRATTLAKSITSLLTDRSISKERIKTVIQWLDKHYSDEFTPKMRKRDDFARNFKRYEEAVQRWNKDNGVEEKPVLTEHDRLCWKVNRALVKQCEESGENWYEVCYRLLQEDIDKVLKNLGLPIGAVKPREVLL